MLRKIKCLMIISGVAGLIISCSSKSGKLTAEQEQLKLVKVNFLKKYGAKNRIFCSDGFLIKEGYLEYLGSGSDPCYDSPEVKYCYPVQETINNDAGIPVRCSDDSKVITKETVKTGILSGNI